MPLNFKRQRRTKRRLAAPRDKDVGVFIGAIIYGGLVRGTGGGEEGGLLARVKVVSPGRGTIERAKGQKPAVSCPCGTPWAPGARITAFPSKTGTGKGPGSRPTYLPAHCRPPTPTSSFWPASAPGRTLSFGATLAGTATRYRPISLHTAVDLLIFCPTGSVRVSLRVMRVSDVHGNYADGSLGNRSVFRRTG